MADGGVRVTTVLPREESEISPADEAANELLRLSRDPAFSPRSSDLADLAHAVRGYEDVHSPWTGVNLQSAFPPASSIALGKRHPLEAALSVLATASIFFPIAWTWWSLQAATRAYSEMLADDSADGRSFLQLWTSGFDSRLSTIHYLTPVATVSVMLILLAVGLIVINRVVDSVSHRNEQRRVAAAEAELSSALTTAERVLITRRTESPQDLERVIRVSVDRLDKANQETAEAANRLHQASEAASSAIGVATSGLTSSLQEVTSASQHLQSSAQVMNQAATQTESTVRNALHGFSDGVQKAVTDFQAANAAAASATTGQLQQALAGLQAAGNAAGSANDSVAKSIDRLSTALATFESDLGTSAGKATQDLVKALDDSQARLTSQVAEIANALARVDEALTATQSATQSQTTELTQARDATERLLRHLEGLAGQRAGTKL